MKIIIQHEDFTSDGITVDGKRFSELTHKGKKDVLIRAVSFVEEADCCHILRNICSYVGETTDDYQSVTTAVI